jgi:hypothetical protein
VKVSPRIARQAAGEARWADSYGALRATSRPSLAIRRACHIKLIEPTMSVFFTSGTTGSWVEAGTSGFVARGEIINNVKVFLLGTRLAQTLLQGIGAPGKSRSPQRDGRKACDKYTYGRGWLPGWGLPEEWQQWPHRQTLATRS